MAEVDRDPSNVKSNVQHSRNRRQLVAAKKMGGKRKKKEISRRRAAVNTGSPQV